MSTKINIKQQGSGVPFFLVLLLLASASFGAWQYNKVKHIKADNKLLSSALIISRDSIEYTKIKLNDTVSVLAAKVKAIYMDKESLKKLYSKEVMISNNLGARLKDISTIHNISMVSSDSVLVPVYIDTLKQLCAYYEDKYIKINTCIPAKGDATISYIIEDSISIIEYFKPHKILWGLIKWSSNTNEYAVFSNNPKTKITGFKVKKIIK